MRKTLIGTSTLILLLAGGSLWWLAAAPAPAPQNRAAVVANPTIDPPTAAPNPIIVNTPTTVTFTVRIPDPALNPAGVNLLRLGANGSSTIVAQMVDNGQNGDQQAGDKIFTARASLNEPTAGIITFQVSAAFKGFLKRSLSDTKTVAIWNQVIDPVSGLRIITPPLTVLSRVVLKGSSGSNQVADLEVFDPQQNSYAPVLSFILYPNPTRSALNTWFLGTIDDQAGTLLNTGVYLPQSLPSGVDALVRSASLPDDFLNSQGPLEEVFATQRNSNEVVGIIQSQDIKLAAYGYTKAAVQLIMNQIANEISQ